MVYKIPNDKCMLLIFLSSITDTISIEISFRKRIRKCLYTLKIYKGDNICIFINGVLLFKKVICNDMIIPILIQSVTRSISMHNDFLEVFSNKYYLTLFRKLT
ncbi:hypothetical protein Cassandra_0251 [Pseudomonas phage Cassandra]|nr:hypothetical protein Cassandra_0251 [Pseudomonas phage Cassandra]